MLIGTKDLFQTVERVASAFRLISDLSFLVCRSSAAAIVTDADAVIWRRYKASEQHRFALYYLRNNN